MHRARLRPAPGALHLPAARRIGAGLKVMDVNRVRLLAQLQDDDRRLRLPPADHRSRHRAQLQPAALHQLRVLLPAAPGRLDPRRARAARRQQRAQVGDADGARRVAGQAARAGGDRPGPRAHVRAARRHIRAQRRRGSVHHRPLLGRRRAHRPLDGGASVDPAVVAARSSRRSSTTRARRARILRAAIAYERGNFGELGDLPPSRMPLSDLYAQAVEWATEASGGLPGS